MKSLEIGLKYVFVSALFASGHRNAIATLASPKSRRAIAAARDMLSKQIFSLHNHLTDIKRANDSALIQSGIAICNQYFTYMAALLAYEWESQYAQHSRMDISEHILYKVSHESPVELETALKTFNEKSLEPSIRVEAFIKRFLIARQLFNDGLEFLGILKPPERDTIIRSIEFQAEYKQAGISLLSYFSEVINKKYPDLDVAVRIEQSGSKVTLVIETPSGEIEKIEHELGRYGLVIAGTLTAEKYMSNPTDAMLLKNKVEIAQLELRQTKELLQLERGHYENRLTGLEDQVAFMRKIFDKSQYDNEQTIIALREIARSSTTEAHSSLRRFIELLQGDLEKNKAELITELTAIARESPSIIDRINELVIKGSIQGAAGNYLYAALASLPKFF